MILDREARSWIGHQTSMRGEGISLHEALARTRFVEFQAGFGARDLLSLIKARRALVGEWIDYSLDKRTTGGWYLLERGEIGCIPESRLTFDSLDEAVAECVVRELDFWAGQR